MALQAKMGYVGFVQLESITGSSGANSRIAVRVTSCDIKTQQAITYPEVIDSKQDTTIYQLGPKETGGSISFPLIHEGSALTNLPSSKSGADCTSTADTLAKTMWEFASKRGNTGRMFHTFNTHVRYADNLAYTYPGCMINSMTWNVVQQDAVTVSADIIGGASTGATSGVARLPLQNGIDSNLKFLSPARVVTWNDVRLALYRNSADETSQSFVRPEEIREFTCTINNGIERFYTINGKLAPQDIAAKKREISGTLKIMGHNPTLSAWTESNEQRFTSEGGIGFGYSIGAGSQPYWATGLYGIVMEMEEVQLSTGLFETSTKWRALGTCDNTFLATKLGTGQSIAYPTPTNYGENTIPNDYPNFTANGN
jgi:hypothetical protein